MPSQCPRFPTCVQGDWADIVELWQSIDLHLQLLVVLDLGLILRQLGVLLVELHQVILSVLFPDWVIARESVQGSSHLLIKYQVKFLLLHISYHCLSILMGKKSEARSALSFLLKNLKNTPMTKLSKCVKRCILPSCHFRFLPFWWS